MRRPISSRCSKFLILNAPKCGSIPKWMDQMPVADVVRLCAHYTVARMLERDDFAKRLREERAIGVHEFLYPLIQGYDSVALRAADSKWGDGSALQSPRGPRAAEGVWAVAAGCRDAPVA